MTSGNLALCIAYFLGWLGHCMWTWAKDWEKDREGEEE